MLKIKNSVLFLIAIISISSGYAQVTDSVLHHYYWNYRERYKKYFTTLGGKAGQSVISAKIVFGGSSVVNSEPYKIKVNTNGKREREFINNDDYKNYDYWGFNDFGDATLEYDQYLGTLATEYWLLKYYHHDEEALNAVKNEIYFALYAIDRLDKYAEKYYDPNNTYQLNGFILRDDIPQDYMKEMIAYAGWPTWHGSNTTRGVWHTDTLQIGANREVKYFGPDGYQIKQAEHAYNINRKTPQWGESTQGEMSQDQLIGILMGIKFLQKYVDWNLEVDPDGPNDPTYLKKNLVTWTAEITDRIMTHISQQRNAVKWFDDEANNSRWRKDCIIDKCGRNAWQNETACPDCDEESEWKIDAYKPNNPTLANSANYVVVNPAKGDRHVNRGPYAFFFGYPLETIGEQLASANQISPKDYPSAKLTLDDEEQLIRYGGDALTLAGFVFGNGGSAGLSATQAVASTFTGLTATQTGCPNALSLDILSTCIVGYPLLPKNAGWWQDIWNAVPKKSIFSSAFSGKDGDLTNNMIVKMAAINGSWTQNDFVDYIDNHNYKYWDIIYALLNDKQPKKDKTFYYNALKNVHPYGTFDAPSHSPFNRNDILSRPNRDITYSYNEHFNGLDFMLIYNLYRIADIKHWQTNSTKITYKEVSHVAIVPAGSERQDYLLYKHHNLLAFIDDKFPGKTEGKWYNFYNTIPYRPYLDNNRPFVNTVTTGIVHPHYLTYGFRAPERISHELTVNSNGKLNIGYDLYFNGTKLTLNNGGEINTTSPTRIDWVNIFKIQKGSTLEIKAGGKLNIENNTKVVIEEGAKLILHTGAIVNLNGLNAVLELNEGQIVMAAGANVTINAGGTNKGFIRVINNWTAKDVPTIIALDANCKLTIAGPLVDFASCADKKILEVHGNSGFVTDWDLKQLDIRNGFIAMDKGARITSNAAYYTTFTTVNINYLDNATNAGTNKHNGIYIPNKNNKFTDVTISNAETGITFFNKGVQNYLNLDNVRIGNYTSIGVMQVGGGFAIRNNCSFNCTGVNIKTVGNSFNSTFFNSQTTGSIWPGTTPQVTGIPMDYHGKGYLYSFKGGFGRSMNMALQVKDAHLRLRCSELNESDINLNYMNARYIQLNGNAYNLFLWPQKTHIKGYGTTNFQLNNGKNYFDKKVFNPAELHFDIKLKLLGSNTPNPNTSSLATLVMPAYGNYFNIDNSNILAQGPMVAKPNVGFNYSIFKTANNISNYIELQIDPPTYKNGSFLPDMDESCVNERHQLTSTVVGGGGAQMRERYNGDFGQQSKSIPPPPQNISPVKTSEQGGVITYKPMHKAVSDNYHRINTGNALGLDSAIKELIYIVSHNNDNTNLILRNEDIEDMQYLYTLMNDAYTFVAIGADSIVIAEQTQMQRVQPYVNNLNMAFQQVWTSATTDSSSVWQDIKYHVATDWAQIHRLANNRPEALNVLNNTEIEISNPIENIGLNKWKCINQMEMAMMQDSTLTLDSALNLYTCIREEPNTAYLDMLQNLEEMWNGGSGNEPFQIQNLNKLAKLAEQKQFALYPNPANSALTISVNKQIIQSIMVYDMHGKLLIKQEPNAINLCQININTLPEGIYNVVVKTNATVYNQKITVVHN